MIPLGIPTVVYDHTIMPPMYIAIHLLLTILCVELTLRASRRRKVNWWLFLTRNHYGTSPLGLYRGLVMKTAPFRLHPRLLVLRGVADLHRRASPSLISVGLNPAAPPSIAARMKGFGWEPGVLHSVVVLRADAGGKWLDVADPTDGLERWPSGDIEWIWNRRALVLSSK